MPAGGAEQLRALGERLQVAAVEVKRELVEGLAVAAREATVPAIVRNTDRLPHSGGLAAQVAAQEYRVDVEPAVGVVRVSAGGMKELAEIDGGTVNHEVFGQPGVRVTQDVEPGFFSDATRESRPALEVAAHVVAARTAAKITRRI